MGSYLSYSSNNNNLDQPNIQNEEQLECSIYPNKEMNEFIYKFDINIPISEPPEFIFIIDKSGSMGKTQNNIISETIPKVLKSLGYENKKIHLITFDNNAKYLYISQSELIELNSKAGGKTYMAKSYDLLETIFNTSKEKCNNFRILVISDGKLHDQNDTKQKGELLYKKNKNIFKINSQAIRLQTGSKTPDSSGIISFLKFNNVKSCELVSLESKEISNLSQKIIELFKEDGLIGSDLEIKGDDINLKGFPWEEGSRNSIPFKNGKNIIFGDKDRPLYIVNKNKNIPLKFEKISDLNKNSFASILVNEKMDNIIQIFKINKILNTDESGKENKLILDYIGNLFKKTIKENNNDKSLEYLYEIIDFYNEFSNKNEIYNLDEEKKAFISKKVEEEKEIKNYKESFNEKSFWNKIKDFGKKIGIKPLYASLILYYAIPKVSFVDKAIIIGSLGYFISPIDVIPDFIPIIGLTDDVAVLMWAFYKIKSNAKNIDDEVKEKAKSKIKAFFNNITDEEIDKLL